MPHLAGLTDESAVELGARRAEPVEDGELPVELVAGDLDHRNLGMVRHLLEGLLPLGQCLWTRERRRAEHVHVRAGVGA